MTVEVTFESERGEPEWRPPAGVGAILAEEEEEAGSHPEIEVIGRAVDQPGPVQRDELAGMVGARCWGPGRFRSALSEAVGEGRSRRISRTIYAPPEEQPEQRGE